MPWQVHRDHREVFGEAVHLVPPRVGAAPAAVNQDKAVTPQGPSRPRASVRNRHSINPKAFPMEPLRWHDWHSGMELWEVTGGKSNGIGIRLRLQNIGVGMSPQTTWGGGVSIPLTSGTEISTFASTIGSRP